MEKTFDLINELNIVRNIPQYFFCSEINRKSAALLRRNLKFYKKLIGIDQEIPELDFIVQSPGGDPNSAFLIINILRYNVKKVNVIIPHYAKSAATLLSLGANEIIMDEIAEMGPLDPQIAKERDDSPFFDYETALKDESALDLLQNKASLQFFSLFRQLYNSGRLNIEKKELSRQIFHFITEFYSPLISNIDPYKLGEKNRILGITQQYAHTILKRYTNMAPSDINRLVYYLANECPDHGFVIDYKTLKGFELNVKLAKEISPEYADTLFNLSNHITLNFDFNHEFNNFVPNKKAVQDVNVDEEATDLSSESEENHQVSLNGVEI